MRVDKLAKLNGSKSCGKLEIILCFENRTWGTEVVDIPPVLYASHNRGAIEQWLITSRKYENVAYIGIYNWMEEE